MKKLLKRLLAYFPTELPTGMTALNVWLEDIVELTGPIANRDDIMFVTGHEVIQLSNTVNRISKMAVVRRIKKYAFNQCMSSILMEINDRHLAAKKAAAKQQQEDTASASATSEQEKQQVVQ